MDVQKVKYASVGSGTELILQGMEPFRRPHIVPVPCMQSASDLVGLDGLAKTMYNGEFLNFRTFQNSWIVEGNPGVE